MENLNDRYLVPFDFTKSTEDALKFTLCLTGFGGGEIILAHIVKHEREIFDAEIKLKKKIAELTEDQQKFVSFKVVEGDIYEDIDKIAQMTDASIIVMGTHGPKGFQKIFGSKALKVVSNAKTPFLLTQEGLNTDHIDSIVMPFSFDRESVQVTQMAAALADKYNAKVHLVGFRHSDEWLLRDMKTNEAIVRKYLKDNKIDHDIHVLPGDKDYEDELMEYAVSVKANMIAAAYFTKGIKSYLAPFLQEMMTNKEKIPVLTINAPEFMTLNSGFSFITT